MLDRVDNIGVVRDHRWIKAEAQIDLLRPRCRVVVSLDGGKVRQVTQDDLAQLLRPGTRVELVHAFLLAEPKGKRAAAMKASFRAAMARIEKRGATIVDVDANICSKAQRRAFLALVESDISRSGQSAKSATNGAKSRGRPALTWTKEEMDRAEATWFDRRHLNNKEAEKHFPKGFTRHRAWRLWGPSGRVPNNPKGVTLSPLRSWAPIPGHTTHEAHRSGQIRNAKTGHVLTVRPLPSGYERVSLPGRRDAYVHEVILETFKGPRPAGCEGSHKNGKNTDNRADNLAWETPSANNQRKTKHGTQLFGEKNPMGRLTHCKRGHPFDQRNTRRANGKRICRICARDHMRRRRAVAKRQRT